MTDTTRFLEDRPIKLDPAGGLFLVAALLLFLSFIAFSLYVDLGKDTWIYGDWIINYSSGFVRRGLIGSLIHLQSIVSPPVALAIVHILLYAAFTALLLFQFWRYRHDLLVMTLLFSPLGLLFFVYNHYAIGRKEILLFTTVLLQINLFARLSATRTNELLYFVALIAMSSVMILSHDGLYFFSLFLDTIFFLFAIKRRSLNSALRWAAAAFILQTALFLICYHYKGSYYNVQIICASLGEFAPQGATPGVFSRGGFLPSDCLQVGGISQLGWDASGAIQTVVHNISRGYPVTYGLTGLIGLTSFALLARRYRLVRGPQSTAVVVFALLSVAYTTPLYVVAIDWGRWMQITYLTLFFLMVYLIDIKFLVMDEAKSRAPYAGLNRFLNVSRGWAFLLAAIFLLTWNPPICCNRVGFGMIDFIAKAWSMSSR
jgi:hypothetical protein